MAEFIMPPRIVSGAGALESAAEALTKMGRRALIVTDEAMVRLGNLEKLTDVLEKAGGEFEVFSGVGGEPTDKMVEAGLSVYRERKCDFLIALGGGSPMDTMKAIGAMSVNNGHMRDYMGCEIPGPLPKMAAIPTTAGTGSEATKFTIITDTEKDVKMLLRGAALMPDIAVIDPAFTVTAPPSVTAATGLDALTHAIEAYTSKKAQPLTDTLALSAVRRIFKYLPIAYRNGGDLEAREQMSLAALEAGAAFNNSSVTIVHGMSRPIGALFHVPHGVSNAMLLPECLAFALSGAYERFVDLARAVGIAKSNASDEENANEFLRAVVDICHKLNIPTLKEYGLDREEFFKSIDKMSDDALISGSPANTRRTVTKADIIAIYTALWR